MTASPTPARRRRARRGSLERPINARLYRGTFLFSALPLMLLAFTISNPAPLPAPTLPTTFDTGAALTLARTLANSYPDRAPGTPGAGDTPPLSGATQWVDQELHSYGLRLSTSSWEQTVPGRGRVGLTNIVAVARGQSPAAILVLAHRDDLGIGPGANDDASGTAVLIELARAYAEPQGIPRVSVAPAHTLVFVSTDGGSFGDLGAIHYLETAHNYGPIVAAINLDALAGSGAPAVEIAGDRPRSPSSVLLATADARIAEASGIAPRHVDPLGQLVDLGFPLTLYDQGPLLASGVPAITLTTGGDRPPPAFGDSSSRLDARRLGELGAGAEELVGSLEQDVELTATTSSYLWIDGRTFSGWAIELLLISLLLPVAAVVVDLYALCRRNRVVIAPAVRALRSRTGFWLFAAAVFTCFRLLGAWPSGPSRPPNPVSPVTRHWPVTAVVLLAVVLLAGWTLARRRLAVRREITAQEELAGYFVALVGLLVVALLVAATNPFALLFVLPALHAWLWLPQLPRTRRSLRIGLFLVGLTGPLLLMTSLAIRFGLGLDAPLYLLELVANGYVSPLAAFVGLAGVVAACQVAAASAGRYAPYPTAQERGPRGPLRELARTVARETGLEGQLPLRRGALGR